MKKQRYMPYFFNYKYERKTYKFIGKDYGDSKTAHKGFFRNVARWWRLHIGNKYESKYKRCDTYNEWRDYVLNKSFYSKHDLDNAIRYFKGKKQTTEILYDIIKTLIIPIYIALFSVTMSLAKEQSPWWIISFTLIILAISMGLIVKYRNEVFFYQAYIECLENRE